MATPSAKSVDASLWWDSFSLLLTELENASLSSELPPSLVKKLNENHAWFLETVARFKPPNQTSRDALEARQVNVGSHQLTVQPEFRDKALKVSSALCLDEVQSYILVKRSTDCNTTEADPLVFEPLHMVMLHYYVERQCLLKCTRQIFMHALYVSAGSKERHATRDEVQKLISDGLESRLIPVLEDLLSSSYPEHMDVDLFTLWAEETLIEENVVLDILFLAYYESFCTCDGKEWRKLCLFYEGMITGTYNFRKLAVSTEAENSIYQAKVQLLLILIETLDLENLLQMIHDEMPFRQGTKAFSLIDIQEMDAIISGFNAFETKEAGPLILAWAVFLCLISSLPGKQEYSVLMEISHVGYVRQAFEAASLNYFLEILQSSVLKDSEGPVAGYRSVLRTFISSFIASYEISLQFEDNNLKLILDILGKIYCGEESLCIQFWDKDSFIDGPIRCLLCNLEGEFPFRIVELVRLLSALCEGSWPAECVYNFLDKSVGLSSLFEISSDSLVDNVSQIVETQLPLRVPGLEGLYIPSRTRGHVLKMVDANSALVRWEYAQSGVLVLLLRLAQEIYVDATDEVLATLDLLGRLVTFNMAVCYSLLGTDNTLYDEAAGMNGQIEKYERVNVIEIICTLVKNLSPNGDGVMMMSMGVNILAKISPSQVATKALKANIFDVAFRTNPLGIGSDGLSSGSWLLSGRLAKMLLTDCQHNDSCCPLTLSVLDFTMQLVETGVENDIVMALVVFTIQYVLVNHEYWKYKVRHVRWKVTLKVLEVVKKCIWSVTYHQKLGEVVRDIILSDTSVHNVLFRIVCTTTQTLEKLYVSRLYEPIEIEQLQLAICSVLDILFIMLFDLSKDPLPSYPVFLQAMLSSTTKPIPVFSAVISLISWSRNPMIQVGAAKVLSMLFVIADYSQQYVIVNACFGLDDKQIADFRNSVTSILREQSPWNEELIAATLKMLTSAAIYQPAFLVSLLASKENASVQIVSNGVKLPDEATSVSLGSKGANLLDALLLYVGKAEDLIKTNPNILLNVLNFLKALWQGAAHFSNILEWLKNSEKFLNKLSTSILLVGGMESSPCEKQTEKELIKLAYQYQCQSAVLQILAYDMFLEKKLLHAELRVKQTSESSGDGKDIAGGTENNRQLGVNNALSTWFESSVLDNVIKAYTSRVYDNQKYLRAKIAAGLFSVHVMGRLKTGDTGSLSVSLIDKIVLVTKKLIDHPAFSEMLAQYRQHGYSNEKELESLVLSDLYYHLRGEFEGRTIDHKPFKELSQYLIESTILQSYRHKYDEDLLAHGKDVYLFDTIRLRADLGLEIWDFSHWKESKAVAETMLLCLQDVNSTLLLAHSRLSSLRALTSLLSVDDEYSAEKKAIGKIPEQLVLSCTDQICQCLKATIESLVPVSDASRDILDFVAAQAELLLQFIRFIHKELPSTACVLVLKTSGRGLKVLSDVRTSVTGVGTTMKLLVMLLLSSLELSCINSLGVAGMGSVEANAEASNATLGLLPILCNCIEHADLCTLALTTIDLILKGFLTPSTWFPIVQKHLRLQLVIQKLQHESSFQSIPSILKFLLTIARVRGGAEMLLNAGFLPSLAVLFADLSDGRPAFMVQSETTLSNSSDGVGKPQHIWGLALAVVTAIITSLGDGSISADIVDYVIAYFFLEKSYLISYYLNSPDFPPDVHDKKRAGAQRTQTSLGALTEKEHTLMLMCVLAHHRNSWIRAMKAMDSQLRERSIHLLAFISRGNQRLGVAPFLCHPILKEEFEWYKKPPIINSRSGWFALSPLGCVINPRFSTLSCRTSAIVIKDQATENSFLAPRTLFSDTTAIQIYRIAFFILKFLCLQAECASRRAEEVGFIDVAHFPELPMPDILHGLQDQGIVIVKELCEGNISKQVSSEVQGVCLLLLQITEMALYLEFCVSQICGIRPVLGRVEDFSKELKQMIRAAEGQEFLKASLKSVKQIAGFVYPGLLQSEGLS
ncbi:hypothetical protein RJ639_037840 [Escallonia herrerae]|uniref:Uncharacterized protein n=1 Tax=Escallonia herrerae TaxID=1293975 RepID=A0AA88WMY8_9ASTE|nr:hypothetical protein RJ639_037840 [Escallonia herrerae]